jgi:hypothetical protein
MLPVLGVFLSLAVPVLWTRSTPYAIEKVGKLFFLTLLAVLAPIVRCETMADLQRLIVAWAGVATLVVGTAAFYPVPESDYVGAPLQTISTDTIGLGRAAGVVFVVAAFALFHSRDWHRGIAFAGHGDRGRRPTQYRLAGPLLAVVVALISGGLPSPGRRGSSRSSARSWS